MKQSTFLCRRLIVCHFFLFLCLPLIDRATAGNIFSHLSATKDNVETTNSIKEQTFTFESTESLPSPKESIAETEVNSDPWYLLDNVTFHYFFSNDAASIPVHFDSSYSKINDEFDANRPTIFIVHGWMTQYIPKQDWLDRLKHLIFTLEITANVFIFDWSSYSNMWNYSQSANYTERMGNLLGHFIQYLIEEQKVSQERLHVIGFSLGGHISGFAGKYLKSKGYFLGRITALDPAGRGFIEVESDRRLDSTDANFVQVLHSNMGPPNNLGNWQRLGHVDVYLNGGARQPGCLALSNGLSHDDAFQDETKQVDKTKKDSKRPRQMIRSYTYVMLSRNRWYQYLYCHHARARRFFEYMYNDKCQPVAYQCSSYADFLHGHCSSCGQNGEKCVLPIYLPETKALEMASLERNTSMSYFVLTRDRNPLCINQFQFKLTLNQESESSDKDIHITIHKNDNETQFFEFKGHFQAGHCYDFLVKSEFFDAANFEFITAQYVGSVSNYIWSKPKLVVDSLNITYMSHIKPEIRSDRSQNYCHTTIEEDFNVLLPCSDEVEKFF